MHPTLNRGNPAHLRGGPPFSGSLAEQQRQRFHKPRRSVRPRQEPRSLSRPGGSEPARGSAGSQSTGKRFLRAAGTTFEPWRSSIALRSGRRDRPCESGWLDHFGGNLPPSTLPMRRKRRTPLVSGSAGRTSPWQIHFPRRGRAAMQRAVNAPPFGHRWCNSIRLDPSASEPVNTPA
jgi:hypothetical protein